MRTAQNQAYALLRFVMGIDMFMHGATRIGGGVEKFANGLVAEFHATILPDSFVHAFGITLPYIEAFLGVLLILGLFTRFALVLGSLLIAALVFGTGLRSDWPTIGLQLIYAVIYYILLTRIEFDSFGIDAARRPVLPNP